MKACSKQCLSCPEYLRTISDITINEIFDIVCNYYNENPETILKQRKNNVHSYLGLKRRANIINSIAMTCYITYKMFYQSISYYKIADFFNFSTHAVVLYHYRKIEKRLTICKTTQLEYNEIMSILNIIIKNKKV